MLERLFSHCGLVVVVTLISSPVVLQRSRTSEYFANQTLAKK